MNTASLTVDSVTIDDSAVYVIPSGKTFTPTTTTASQSSADESGTMTVGEQEGKGLWA